MTKEPKPTPRRNLHWTHREDENGLMGKTLPLTGTEFAELAEGAVSAGFTNTRRKKGEFVDVPNVRAYVVWLHRKRMG